VPVLVVLTRRLLEENHRLQDELESREGALHSSGLIEWLVEDGPMGGDNNEVWDWEGNNE